MWPFSGTKYPVISLEQAGTPLQVKQLEESKVKTYDYIIVGGGTAGCCLAGRLSEDPSISVLLLERGSVHDAWFSRIPLISSDVTSKATPIVRSSSAPIKAAESQVVDVVHAQTLGGGSSVNAMLVTRGAVGDFNHWAELGHPSWDYASLKPYFIKSEKSLSQTSGDRGYSGPLVNQTFPDLPFKVQRKVRDAAISLGFADVKDLNSSTVPVDVCATLDAAIDESMRRVSSYHTFLPAHVAQDRRERLKVCTNAVATRVDFDGNVAVGVVFEPTDETRDQTFYARAKKEVVICCGALGSPQLLLLSVVDLPGVGAHLQDHVGLPLMYEVPLEDTLHHIESSTLKGILEFGKYVFARKGILASTSVGSVRLVSRDPHARPTVDLGFLSNPEDFVPFRRGVTLSIRLAQEVRRQGYEMKDFQVPASEQDVDVDKFVRATIRTSYHYASSCRMGRREDGGVVNDNLEVYGIRGLRVCDASVFPCITSRHTMTPVIVVAEKCADLMKQCA
ncbi:hypothetical protein K438DRAFT_1832072 [Mycena galopus ATCC 62051]|nr:hypothetical protein K438DRAFT_1832072 [Mycena galopus ATCC 62051]